jgi:hypothetical protein
MRFRLAQFRSIWTVVGCSLIGCATLHAAQLDHNEPQEITIVQPLGLDGWNHLGTTDKRLEGSWKGDKATISAIFDASVDMGMHLVVFEDRVVPAFQIETKSKHFLVLATHADEELRLIPTVYEVSFSLEGNEMTLVNAVIPVSEIIDGVESLKLLLENGEYEIEDSASLIRI